MLKLFYFHPACSLVPHIALEESGLDYEAVPVDLTSPAGREELITHNPAGKVPTLLIGDQVLTENAAILTYIDGAAPHRQLIPADPLMRAQTVSFLSWASNTVHPAFRQDRRPYHFSDDEASHDSIRAKGRALFWRYLQEIDTRLADRAWTMGEAFSVAEGYTLLFYRWGTLLDLPVGDLPAYTRTAGSIMARPAVQRVLDRETASIRP